MGDISSLAKQVAKQATSTDNGTLMYGTVADGGVKLDGASVVTPATFAVEAKAGERVMCRILNHTVTVTSNVSDPSAGTEKVEEISGYALDAHNILVKIADDKTTADEIVEAINGKFTEANDAAADAKKSAEQAISDAATANKAAQEATLYAKDALDKAGVATQAAEDAKAAKEAAQKSADSAAELEKQAEESASKAQSAQDAVNTAISNIQNSIVESLDQFYLSDSPTTLTGGSWSTTATWTAGKYIWTRTRVIRYLDKDKANPYTYMPDETGTCITGNTGATGAKGDKGDTGDTGAKGDAGKDGTSFQWNMLYETATPKFFVGLNKENQGGYLYSWSQTKDVNFPDAFELSSKYTVSCHVEVVDDSDAEDLGTVYFLTSPQPKAWQEGVSRYDALFNRKQLSRGSFDWVETFTTRSASDWSGREAFSIVARFDYLPTTTTVTVSNLKIEPGTTASPWCTTQAETVGADGKDGTGINSVARYYTLADTGTSASSLTPSTSWATTEPAYTAGKSLYFADLTTKTDGTTSWSAVSLSSSYTAATDAQETANGNISSVPIVYYRLTDGSTPTAPTDADSTGWSTSISSATAQLSGGFTSGCKYWTCTYTLYGDGSHQWGSVTYAETETTAATNEYNVKMAGQRFSYDSAGAHVIGLQSDGTIPSKVDITSDGMTVYRTVDGSTHDIAHFGYNSTTASAESRVGELSGAHTVTDTSGIHFYGKNNPSVSIADIDSDKSRMDIKQANVSDYMQFASFAWFARGKHMSLKVVEQ